MQIINSILNFINQIPNTIINIIKFIAPYLLFITIVLSPLIIFATKLLIMKALKKSARKRQKIINLIKKKQIKEAEIKQVQSWKSDNTEYYKYAQHLFHDLMQQRRIDKWQVQEFNMLIDSHLGNYAEQYKKMKFQNSAHKIYTKLHCYHLSQYNYINLIKYLENIAEQTQKQNNINNKGDGLNAKVVNFKSI